MCPYKTEDSWQFFLPFPTIKNFETREKFWIHASNVVLGVRGVVGHKCFKKQNHKYKFLPWLLSMIVALAGYVDSRLLLHFGANW